jgi:hypothetical protein
MQPNNCIVTRTATKVEGKDEYRFEQVTSIVGDGGEVKSTHKYEANFIKPSDEDDLDFYYWNEFVQRIGNEYKETFQQVSFAANPYNENFEVNDDGAVVRTDVKWNFFVKNENGEDTNVLLVGIHMKLIE